MTAVGKITITSGPAAGTEYPLADSQVVGRLKKCGVPLQDTRASREHARIYKSQGTYFITDLNSKNGVTVNEEQVRKAELNPGDRIQVGETWMRIEFEREEVTGPEERVEDAGRPVGPGIQVRGTGGVSAEPIATASYKRTSGFSGQNQNVTRTSLAWLRTDLAQVSFLYRFLLGVGVVLLTGGIGYLVYLLILGV